LHLIRSKTTEQNNMTGYQSKRESSRERVDPLAWAHKLKAKEEAGHKLTQAIKEMWRRALKHHD
jgi:hypothetical protein